MQRNETRDYFDSRSQDAQRYAQNTELPQWLRNAWQAVADGRISSPAEYRDAPKQAARKPAAKPAEKRERLSTSRESIAQKAQRQARERYQKLYGKRYDPYQDQD